MSIILGHRGASGYAPENTLEAFRLAMDMGADGFELDVHLSKDGELIVMHDERVDRTTDGSGLIQSFTLKELKALDASNGMAKYKGAKVPTLGELYDLIRDTRHVVNVEIKTDQIVYPGIAEKVLKLEQEKGMEGRILYSSFNHYTLMELKAIKPDVKFGILYSDAPLSRPDRGLPGRRDRHQSMDRERRRDHGPVHPARHRRHHQLPRQSVGHT